MPPRYNVQSDSFSYLQKLIHFSSLLNLEPLIVKHYMLLDTLSKATFLAKFLAQGLNDMLTAVGLELAIPIQRSAH